MDPQKLLEYVSTFVDNTTQSTVDTEKERGVPLYTLVVSAASPEINVEIPLSLSTISSASSTSSLLQSDANNSNSNNNNNNTNDTTTMATTTTTKHISWIDVFSYPWQISPPSASHGNLRYKCEALLQQLVQSETASHIQFQYTPSTLSWSYTTISSSTSTSTSTSATSAIETFEIDQVTNQLLTTWLANQKNINNTSHNNNTTVVDAFIYPLQDYNVSARSGALFVLTSSSSTSLTQFWSLQNALNKKSIITPTHLLLQYCNSSLSNYFCQAARRQSDILLQVARSLLDTTGNIDDLLKKIMIETRALIGADRCSFFLVDKERDELWAKLFDLEAPADATAAAATTTKTAASSTLSTSKGVVKIRFPITKGIAGHVYQTGRALNIADAYAHPLFNREIDDLTGFQTRSMLTFPVFNGNEVIGVVQAINKSPSFSADDERIGADFAILAGLALRQSLLNEERFKAEHNAKVALEILSYHRQVKSNSVETLVSTATSFDANTHFPNFTTFSFSPRLAVPLDDTIKSAVFMFDELNVPTRWRISREVVVRFLLTVQLGYRDVPYHNWFHAFSVAHFSYLLAKKTNLKKYVGEDEIAALFIACLGHDIDHRGTTNNYQELAGSSLAALYSSQGSVLERHHLAQTLQILNSEGCNLLANLDSREYRIVLDRIRKNILATDLAHHFSIRKRISDLVEEIELENANPSSATTTTATTSTTTTSSPPPTPTETSSHSHSHSHSHNHSHNHNHNHNHNHHGSTERSHRVDLICSLAMTASDLSDASKPWESSCQVARLIYAEFFAQGDMERSRGATPAEMYDRTKANKPKLQLGFIDHVAMPVFKLLAKILPEAKEVENTVQSNRDKWQEMVDQNINTV